jgi:hypothetical protein
MYFYFQMQILNVICEGKALNTHSVHFTRILCFNVIRRASESWGKVRVGKY